jgi:serine/threonine protein kinase
MREKIRRVVQEFKSAKLEGQDEGYIVFGAEEPGTGQRIRIKIPPRLLGQDPQIAAGFRRLSQSIRQLNHPNIASVRTVGEREGLPYIVTRTIEKARPLVDKLDQPWAVDVAADMVMQVGQALEHAYRKGVVHGSLSPDKIVMHDDGRVQVTDFGTSELLELLGVHLKQGASPYLAPERLEGMPADARADVYSLASVLYGLLAKREPQVVDGEVLPPSRFNPDVPAEMDRVVVKALAPDAADRYPDAKSFLAALGSVTLAPAVVKAKKAPPSKACPQCGAGRQTGRFCRKCGARLDQPAPVVPPPAESILDEPIQVTEVTVGRVKMGKGLDVHDTVIASSPVPVATGELAAEFPQALEMPQLDLQILQYATGTLAETAMPEPPPMPVIDWGEVAPPMPGVPTIEDVHPQEDGETD